jgi:hypothetical protein
VPPADIPDPTRSRTRTLVFTAVAGLLVAGLLFSIVGRVASTGGTARSGSGDSLVGTFTVGSAGQLAGSVARSGPFLFPDPQGRSRDIFVQHLGGNEWTAFEARATGSPRQCVLRWEQAAHHFVDPCDGRIYPADGTGLVSFPTTVNDKGKIVVDLSSPISPTVPTVPTTEAPAY